MFHDVFIVYPWGRPTLAVLGGLIIGSFLNVVIWRYPIMIRQQMAAYSQVEAPSSVTQPVINLAWPPSSCPHCRERIRLRDNIPLLSWLVLRGRCRACHAAISWRYPLVELLGGILFLVASLVWPASGWSLAVMALSAWLIVASLIDIDHQWLPDVLTQGVLWTGILAAWVQVSPLALHEAVSGVLVGFVAFYALRWLAGTLLRREALGMGDVLLFAGLGAWVGPLSLPRVALLASLGGLIYAVITRRMKGSMPFGPCLSMAGMVTLYGQALLPG